MPELTLSGINKGANLGDDVFYSGTVGAAREAALNGIPALAVSLHTAGSDTTFHYEAAAEFALMVAKQMIEHPLPHGVLLNLNVPNLPLNQINGLEICRLGRRHYEPMVEARIDPRNKAYYWIGGSPLGELMGEGTDGYWIAQGFATLTPLGLDNTHTGFLSNLEGWTLNPRKRSEHE
jgi:5'-nucleotidase